MAPNKKTKTDLLLLPSHVACGFCGGQAARVREGALGKLLGHGAQQAHQPRLRGCSWETEQKHGSPKHLTAQLPTEGRSLAPHASPRERGSSWHTRRRPQGCRHRLGRLLPRARGRSRGVGHSRTRPAGPARTDLRFSPPNAN